MEYVDFQAPTTADSWWTLTFHFRDMEDLALCEILGGFGASGGAGSVVKVFGSIS